MEKIYMEDENNSEKVQKNSKFSIVLSFFVAFFAVFSLLAFGFDQMSYAEPAEVAGKNMTFYVKMNDTDVVRVVGKNNDGSTTFGVPLYFEDQNMEKAVFCIEKEVHNPADRTGLSLLGKTDDAGIAYIINNSFIAGHNMLPETLNTEAETWATQVAIWVYLYEKDSNNSNYAITADEMNAIRSATKLVNSATAVTIKNYNKSIYDNYVAPIVSEAHKASAAAYFEINKENNKVYKVGEGEYYQTSKLSVSGDEGLLSYDVEISGVEGAFIVDTDGKTISPLTGLPPTKEFYVRIPSKSLDSVKNLKIKCTGNFDTYEPYTYYNGNTQKIARVYQTSTTVPLSVDYEVVGTPSTGMNATQTIYFVGLIVLLCGVGIVYANAKPVKE